MSNPLFGPKRPASPAPKITKAEQEATELREEIKAWEAKGGVVLLETYKTVWKMNGLLHRDEDKPAIVLGDRKSWYKQGQLHREKGPARKSDHGEEWWLDGKRHRVGGPAICSDDGTESWWLDDQKHRLDGPAVTTRQGNIQYWINGVKMDEQEFKARTKP